MTAGITPIGNWARKNIRIRNEYITQPIAEFFGTLILCLFAVAGACQNIIMEDSHMMPVFGGVFGIMIAVTATGGISGAHINPAVTFGIALSGHLNWFKVPLYWVSQFIGAYCGAGIGFGLYKDKLALKFGEDFTSNANLSGIFSHYPGIEESGFLGTGLADQIVSTSVLLFVIFGMIDPRNMGVPKWFIGPFFALAVAGIAFTMGLNAGAVMNPARDLGPRFMAISVGWEADDVFMFKDASTGELRHYWLIPLFGPMIGAFIGTITYIFFIGSHLHETEQEKKEVEEAQGNNNNRFKSHQIPKAVLPDQTVNYGPHVKSIINNNNNSLPHNGYYSSNSNYNNNNNNAFPNGVRNPAFAHN